ncbi:MAG: carboxylesterase family protein [Caldilineaceae bacterium]
MTSPVQTAHGQITGALDPKTGVHSFKGIPSLPRPSVIYVGAPQPVTPWDGVREAVRFGPRYAVARLRGHELSFRRHERRLPTSTCGHPIHRPPQSCRCYVYFYGGGFIAGDGSEPPTTGEQMARKGIVALTVNYRLNIFGFFATPN